MGVAQFGLARGQFGLTRGQFGLARGQFGLTRGPFYWPDASLDWPEASFTGQRPFLTGQRPVPAFCRNQLVTGGCTFLVFKIMVGFTQKSSQVNSNTKGLIKKL